MVYLSILSPHPLISPVLISPTAPSSSSSSKHQPVFILKQISHSPIRIKTSYYSYSFCHSNFTSIKPTLCYNNCNNGVGGGEEGSNEQLFSQEIDTDDDEDDEGGVADFVDNTNIISTRTRDDVSSFSSGLPERWDVLGLGQAMVDFSGMVDDEFLERVGIDKGTRKLVNHEERGRVLRAMDGCTYKAAAGGSLSNTLVALARLGAQPFGGPPLNVAVAGSVGSDPLGGFYKTKLRRANVNFLSEAVTDGTTGTVIVLTTPDAQRTMLAYQGTSSRINYDPCLASIISKTNILVVEGYLFELPDTIKAITKACEAARNSGAIVAVTASDVSCIERHYDNFW